VEYFRNVAAGWPAMWDGSMNAAQRFRLALLRYGDQLWSQGDACAAADIYEEAKAFGELMKRQPRMRIRPISSATPRPRAHWRQPARRHGPPTGEPPTSRRPKNDRHPIADASTVPYWAVALTF
jgi:hypothetical protein